MYRFTSIARPIDPAYLTNRALLIILPLLMLLSAVLASIYDMGSSPMTVSYTHLRAHETYEGISDGGVCL